MCKSPWVVSEDETDDVVLAVKHSDRRYEASVLPDGAITLYQDTGVISVETVSVVHFRDLDEVIQDLARLRDMAQSHFGKDWKAASVP